MMLKSPISIVAMSSLSPLGGLPKDVLKSYLLEKSFISEKIIEEQSFLAGKLPPYLKTKIESLKTENSNYKHLDHTVLYAIYCARQLLGSKFINPSKTGINIGSSRGATLLFEKYFEEFATYKKLSPYSSPTTTLGNISSWVAQDLSLQGLNFSHSITCSTALHAILNGIAWLSCGFCTDFIAGGSEAPLTPFTFSQMQALKICSAEIDSKYPCRALDLEKKKNTMILAEAASLFLLQKDVSENTIAKIIGVGYGSERLKHSSSISEEGLCFQKSMRMATTKYSDVDIIITHSPGTIKGDEAEYHAIRSVFGRDIPSLTNNKWKVGHSLGTSGALSMEMAILMLQNQTYFPVPYLKDSVLPQKINKILINSAGFGGNAVSILLSN